MQLKLVSQNQRRYTLSLKLKANKIIKHVYMAENQKLVRGWK